MSRFQANDSSEENSVADSNLFCYSPRSVRTRENRRICRRSLCGEVDANVRILKNRPVVGAVLVGLLTLLPAGQVRAEGKVVGPNKCEECHKQEAEVWKGTKHFKAFKEIEKNPKAKAVLAAVGDATMKKSKTCQLCHFSVIDGQAKFGTSCESCHGAASDWIGIHNDYGGVEKDKEEASHKEKRLKEAASKGMRTSQMHYEIAQNCCTCHGLANPKLDATVLGKMLDAGHPIEPDWEFVRYSQGTVRHRFYPVPTGTENKEMTAAEKARFYVIGAAAKLASAKKVQEKSDNAKFKEAQEARASAALEVLNKVKGEAAVAAFIKSPGEAAGKKLEEAIREKDLSGKLGELPSSDK